MSKTFLFSLFFFRQSFGGARARPASTISKCELSILPLLLSLLPAAPRSACSTASSAGFRQQQALLLAELEAGKGADARSALTSIINGSSSSRSGGRGRFWWRWRKKADSDQVGEVHAHELLRDACSGEYVLLLLRCVRARRGRGRRYSVGIGGRGGITAAAQDKLGVGVIELRRHRVGWEIAANHVV